MEIKMHIIYENVDGLVQASVAELPGAISLGNTIEEARKNLDEAIELVLEGNRLLAAEVERAKISSEEIAFLKRIDMVRYLERNGCELAREGKQRTPYVNRETKRSAAVPRHREIPAGTARAICRALGIVFPI